MTMTSMTPVVPPARPDIAEGHIAILVVHGIGAQKPGETIRKLTAGLERVERGLESNRRDGLIRVGGQPLRLYEVYWADLLSGDVTRGAFQIAELQSLSWFPWFNYRCGNYQPGTYSTLKLVRWWVSLPIFNFFVLFAYYGARLIAQLLGTSESPEESDVSLSTIWRDATRAADSAKLSVLDRILDEYVGDVFSYVNSAGNAFYRENNEPSVPDAVVNVYPQIMQRFYDQLLKAQADGCTEMQVVAHSLGAVIAYHALSGLSADPERRMDTEAIRSASGNVRRLYTIGSPLEKIRFFWPRLVARPLAVGALTLQWDNFVSWFDPVAGTLKRLTTWGDVVNHRLLGGGFLRGHVVYERSPVFLGALTRGLCGREIPLVRTFKERWWDRLILIGETLLAPTAVAVVLICGMALFLLTALLLPFLISLILRQFLVESTWVSIENTSSLILIASMVIAFVLGPLIRASKVHRLYWVGSAGKP